MVHGQPQTKESCRTLNHKAKETNYHNYYGQIKGHADLELIEDDIFNSITSITLTTNRTFNRHADITYKYNLVLFNRRILQK